jgi:hypothetical protein
MFQGRFEVFYAENQWNACASSYGFKSNRTAAVLAPGLYCLRTKERRLD